MGLGMAAPFSVSRLPTAAAATQKDNVNHLVSIGDVSRSSFDHIADPPGLLADAKYRRCGGFFVRRREGRLPRADFSRYNRGTRALAAPVTAGPGSLWRHDYAAEEADGGERMKLDTVRVNGGHHPCALTIAEVTISGIGILSNPVETR
jgi:hypothetical protein